MLKEIEILYFPLYARADCLKLLLSHANIPFKEVTVEFKDWPELKKDQEMCPFGSLPVAVIDGVRMGQTMAILRCLAIKLEYYNTDSAEIAWACDQIMDTWSTVMDRFSEA